MGMTSEPRKHTWCAPWLGVGVGVRVGVRAGVGVRVGVMVEVGVRDGVWGFGLGLDTWSAPSAGVFTPHASSTW